MEILRRGGGADLVTWARDAKFSIHTVMTPMYPQRHTVRAPAESRIRNDHAATSPGAGAFLQRNSYPIETSCWPFTSPTASLGTPPSIASGCWGKLFCSIHPFGGCRC